MQLLNIHQKYGYMVVVELGDSMENGVLSNAVGAGVRANRFYSTFREIAQDFFECLVGPIMGNRIVLLVPYEKLLLPGADPARQRVLQNLVRTISDKYFLLSRRVDLLVLKSLRAKVCAYLLNESERAGSLTFSIPFSRVQLADYLNCDRSALSRELSLMQKDGLLDTFKSSFKLLDPDALKQMVQ